MFPNRTTRRKRWNIQGPRGSLRWLRNELADYGCVESQYVLAKQLLEEPCELEADRLSNFKQALEWLICATEQGHEEGRDLLRRCVRSNVMSEINPIIVKAKSCLAASRQENVARRAARELFNSLSNGEEFITTAQLEARIREICNVELHKREEEEKMQDELLDGDKEINDNDETAAIENGNGDASKTINSLKNQIDLSVDYDEQRTPTRQIQNLTIDNLITAAAEYCQGEIPLVTYDINLTDPNVNELNHVPLLQQAFLHPIIFVQVLYLKLLYYFSGLSLRLSNFELILLFIGYFILGRDNLTLFAPLVFYYLSFVTMIVSTFKMLHTKRQFVDFRKWSGLFLRYSEGNLQADESEGLFVKNNLKPFLHFFMSLLVNLFLYPFITSQWIPFSEFSVISFFLMLTTLASFSLNEFDLLALLSLSINVLAKYPYENDTVVTQGWRFIDIHFQSFPTYVLGNSIEFCLNSRGLFSLCIPFLLIAMSKRDKWNGFFKYTIPHCVTLSWLQLFLVCSQSATMYGLIRGTLALACMFFFLPIVGIVTLILPVMACLQCITLSDVLTAVFAVSGLLSFLVVSCFLARLESTKKFVTPFQLVIGLLALAYMSTKLVANQGLESDSLKSTLMNLVDDKKDELRGYLSGADYSEHSHRLTWEEYYENCHKPSWERSTQAKTQLKCSVLAGTHVDWQGYVEDVKISSVENKWYKLSQYIPPFLREIFNCYYGDEYSTLCASHKSYFNTDECRYVQNAARNNRKRCHLNRLNCYTHKLAVKMENIGGIMKSHTHISLQLDNTFTNLTLNLNRGDQIFFKGMLINSNSQVNTGSEDVLLDVYEVLCVDCLSVQINGAKFGADITKSSKFETWLRQVYDDAVVSWKNVLNFVLNPVVIFK